MSKQSIQVKNQLTTVCFYHVHMRFRVNPHSIVAWMSRNFLLELSDCNGTLTNKHLVREVLSLAKWLGVHLRIKWIWVPLISVNQLISYRRHTYVLLYQEIRLHFLHQYNHNIHRHCTYTHLHSRNIPYHGGGSSALLQ